MDRSVYRLVLVYFALFLYFSSSFIITPKVVEMSRYTFEETTEDRCKGYDGVLLVDKTDMIAGAGTAFFLYIVNYIIYAQDNNLMPWVHFEEGTGKIYDPRFHHAHDTKFKMIRGLEIPSVGDALLGPPGRPNVNPDEYRSKEKENIVLHGNGIWNTYFEPINSFDFNDESCADLPLFSFSANQVYPGFHTCASWAVRAWDYNSCEIKELRPGSKPEEGEIMHDWLGKQRRVASPLVQKYIKPAKWLQEMIDNTNPISRNEPPCLAMHIQLSDKGGRGHNMNSLDMFLPFAKVFVSGGGKRIFIATDTANIFEEINSLWPSYVTKRIWRQSNMTLSDSDKRDFDLVDHHQSNTEAITNIYAMAKCSLLVHGYSALTEAAIYLNPTLHDFSVNLDYNQKNRKKVFDFRKMVRKVLK